MRSLKLRTSWFVKNILLMSIFIFFLQQIQVNSVHAMAPYRVASYEGQEANKESYRFTGDSDQEHLDERGISDRFQASQQQEKIQLLVVELIALTNDRETLRRGTANQTPDQIWQKVIDSRFYRAGKVVTMVTSVFLTHTCILVPGMQALLSHYSRCYDAVLGCENGAAVQSADSMSAMCDSMYKNMFLGATILPISYQLHKRLNKIGPMICDATDYCSQVLIQKILELRGRYNPLKIEEVDAMIIDVSNQLKERSAELRELPTDQRREIFYLAALSGQIDLMKSVLRPDDSEEQRVLERLATENCSICLDGLDQKSAPLKRPIETGCEHQFHESCLVTWYQEQLRKNSPTSCPNCRTLRLETAPTHLLSELWPHEESD